MECVLIAFVYVVVFVGVFVCYGVPWLFSNIVAPLFWHTLVVIVYLLDNAISPAIRRLGEAVKGLWREIYYWSVGDVEQD